MARAAAGHAARVATLSLDARRRETDETTVPLAPEKLADAAYYGLAGEIVQAIEPHSEADPVALLVQLLAAVGSALNRTPHYLVEADRHYLNLFCLLVGSTSGGRKGTSLGRVLDVMRRADDIWSRRHESGLSSGEGLIWQLRDPIMKESAKGSEPVDPGVTDKRLLVVETEFGRVLKAASREGNTLSAVLRQAWETGDLSTLTKNAQARATGAHISLIGHITPEELRRQLDAVEVANGLLNRFLVLWVRRSKFLPEGGDLDPAALTPLVRRLSGALMTGRAVSRMHRDDPARALWAAVYPALATGRPGLLGSVTSRAAAQVTRLSCLYAILDGGKVIGVPHLEAALALWRYCEASARFVLGETLGDPVADDIMELLGRSADGCTRTEIRDAFNRHRSGDQITTALGLLQSQGLVDVERERTPGRPVERWRRRQASVASAASVARAPVDQRENGARPSNTGGICQNDISDLSDRSKPREGCTNLETGSYGALDAPLDAGDEVREAIEERLLEREAMRDD